MKIGIDSFVGTVDEMKEKLKRDRELATELILFGELELMANVLGDGE